jgi:hypothetical protein
MVGAVDIETGLYRCNHSWSMYLPMHLEWGNHSNCIHEVERQ